MKMVGGCSMHDLGFWGNTITFMAATIFWIATITGVPNVMSEETDTHYVGWDIVYWLPQVRDLAIQGLRLSNIH